MDIIPGHSWDYSQTKGETYQKIYWVLISAIAYITGILSKTKWQRNIDMSVGLEMHNSTKAVYFS